MSELMDRMDTSAQDKNAGLIAKKEAMYETLVGRLTDQLEGIKTKNDRLLELAEASPGMSLYIERCLPDTNMVDETINHRLGNVEYRKLHITMDKTSIDFSAEQPKIQPKITGLCSETDQEYSAEEYARLILTEAAGKDRLNQVQACVKSHVMPLIRMNEILDEELANAKENLDQAEAVLDKLFG